MRSKDVLDLRRSDTEGESSERSMSRRVRITADDGSSRESESLLRSDDLLRLRKKSALRRSVSCHALRIMRIVAAMACGWARKWNSATYMNDTLSFVGQAEKVEAKLLNVLLERDDLETRIGDLDEG